MLCFANLFEEHNVVTLKLSRDNILCTSKCFHVWEHFFVWGWGVGGSGGVGGVTGVNILRSNDSFNFPLG